MLSKFFALLSSLKTTTPTRPVRSRAPAPELPPTDDAGVAGERSWDIEGFARLSCEGPVEILWERSPQPGAQAMGDQAQLDKISVSLIDGELRVSAPSLVSRSPLKIVVRSNDLERLEGAAGAQISAFDLSCPDLRVRQEGPGSMFLTGACMSADFFAAGGGSIDASLLRCECVAATVSGKSKVECFANVSVMATADTVGGLKVHGNPAHSESVVKAGGRVKVYGAPPPPKEKPGGGIFDHVSAPRN